MSKEEILMLGILCVYVSVICFVVPANQKTKDHHPDTKTQKTIKNVTGATVLVIGISILIYFLLNNI